MYAKELIFPYCMDCRRRERFPFELRSEIDDFDAGSPSNEHKVVGYKEDLTYKASPDIQLLCSNELCTHNNARNGMRYTHWRYEFDTLVYPYCQECCERDRHPAGLLSVMKRSVNWQGYELQYMRLDEKQRCENSECTYNEDRSGSCYTHWGYVYGDDEDAIVYPYCDECLQIESHPSELLDMIEAYDQDHLLKVIMDCKCAGNVGACLGGPDCKPIVFVEE